MTAAQKALEGETRHVAGVLKYARMGAGDGDNKPKESDRRRGRGRATGRLRPAAPRRDHETEAGLVLKARRSEQPPHRLRRARR